MTMLYPDPLHLVENHFVENHVVSSTMTFGQLRQLVDYDNWSKIRQNTSKFIEF